MSSVLCVQRGASREHQKGMRIVFVFKRIFALSAIDDTWEYKAAFRNAK